jgi:drug/metabolite transporter (DMT)-like permease
MVANESRKEPASDAVRVWIALATVYLVWGSTYLAIRVMVETIPPVIGAGVRFLVAGAVLSGWLLFRGGRARLRVSRRELLVALAIGILLLFGGNGLVTVAEQAAPSGLAALIIAAVPLWVVLLRLVTSDRVSWVTLAGTGVGFVGVASLVVPGDRPDGAALWAVLILVVASACWATASFLSSRAPLPKDVLVSTALQMVLGGAFMLALGLAVGEGSELDVGAYSLRSLVAFVYLVVAGSLVAFTAYIWLLQNAPVSTVATYAFVNPVVAVLLGWALLEEELTAGMIAGATAVVASVAFVVRNETRAAAEVPPPKPAVAPAGSRGEP